jgi:serine/threonine protein kinase
MFHRVFRRGEWMSDADWIKYKRLRGKDLPENVDLTFGRYVCERVFKNDFYAATAVYRKRSGPGPEQVVLKEYHTDRWGPIPLGWLGRMLLRRESLYFRELDHVPGVPRYLEPFGVNGFAREHISGLDLREHFEKERKRVGPDFFPRLQVTLKAVHEKGIAHNDLAKPENVLVCSDGSPVLIDFQIALMPKRWKLGFGRLAGPLLRLCQRMDDYHLCKQYRRYAPDSVPDEIRKKGTRSGGVAGFHYHFIRRPYRAIRHFFLDRFLTLKPEAETQDDQSRKAA